jgi:C4-dicarboxylate-specific signal transduction histidine kinase
MYPIDINEPIKDVFSLLGEQLRLRDIEIRLHLDKRLPKILADKNRLEQIFLNLATNSRDSLETKGKNDLKQLKITTTQENGHVVVLFSDTGTGMTRDVREKIFEPFFTTKETGKGTGLGLSITYNLVKDFSGDIHVLSTSKEGTTFKITFPTYRIERNKDEQSVTH